jgi:hypothetical protein
MAKRKEPLLVALEAGESYTWTIPDGGDLASMRAAVKHGQTITMSPIKDPAEIQAGDIVYVKWHQGYLFHLVGQIENNRYLITNSLGKENGWVAADAILGRVTQIIEPEPRPSVDRMLERLQHAFDNLQQQEATDKDGERLATILADLRWYGDRIGSERWDEMPRSNIWSFAQNLWRLTKEAEKADAPVDDRIHYFIDRGKACVGLASEIYARFEYHK